MSIARLFAAATLGALFLVTSAADAGQCRPRVRDAWLRMPPGPAGMMLAGFARIENPCGVPVAITGAGSTAFGDVSLHETRLVDGVSRMRAVPELRVAANSSVELKPGGLHLMLMQSTRAVKPGSRVPVEFRLAGGGVLRGDFEVRGFGR